MAGVHPHTQTNMGLNINERREFPADSLEDQVLLQQLGPIVEFDLTVKRYDKQELIDLDGTTIQTRVTPSILNRRMDFPLHRSSTYLTRFLSSIPLIPQHLVYDTAFEICDYAFPSYNPIAAVIHIKAELTVSNVTTALHSPLPWIDDDSIVVDVGEDELEPDHHLEPDQLPQKLRSVRDLKERYGFCAASETGGEVDDQLGNCAVCLEELGKSNSSRDNLLKMPCSHVFHCPCISKWLQGNDSCPLCRSVIP